MNRNIPRKFSSICLGVAAFTLSLGSAHAQAIISWSTPTFITGDADVASVETRIWAYNFGTAAVSPIVNGVTFTGYASNTGNSDFTLTTVGSTIYHFPNSFGNTQAFYTSLSSGYQDLLRSATFWSGQLSHTQTMTLHNLTPGHTYQIQFWVNDSRASYHNTESVSFADTFGNEALVRYSNNGATLGQYVIGTFTAAAELQTIDLGPFSPQINAATLGLAAIPEPATTALLLGAAAMIGVVLIRARRRNQK